MLYTTVFVVIKKIRINGLCHQFQVRSQQKMTQNSIEDIKLPDTGLRSCDTPQIHPVLKHKNQEPEIIEINGKTSSLSAKNFQLLDNFKISKHDISWGAITVWDETSERHSPPPYHHQSQRNSLEELLKRPKRSCSVSSALAGLIMVLFVVFLVATIMSAYYSLKHEINGGGETEWGD